MYLIDIQHLNHKAAQFTENKVPNISGTLKIFLANITTDYQFKRNLKALITLKKCVTMGGDGS